MIGISKLYCGTVESSDVIRYANRPAKALPSHLLQFSKDKKPVVVWNVTRACNLTCHHCYAHATRQATADEMSFEQGLAFIDSLAEFGTPVLLFSGGEPLVHPHIFDYIERAVKGGLRAVLSTNGLLIDEPTAARLASLGLSYVGVSLDGLGATHDRLRARPGAFKETLKALETVQRAGIKLGLRLTLTKDNSADLPKIFDFVEEKNIPRICFYHLVPKGRGASLGEHFLNAEESRAAVDLIIDRTADLAKRGRPVEVLTVDNHADGPYLYLRLLKEGKPERAAEVLKLLRLNGGNSSGHGLGAVSWNGDVHPDQFWRDVVLGSVKERTFSEIWHDENNALLQSLKRKAENVTGRCRNCSFLPVCGGNLRARAEAATGEIWGVDPACYLTDEEIATELPS